MKSHEFIKEDGTGTNDYQQMMTFLNRNKTPGVPQEQQLALAMFRELQKTQQHNQQLDAELAAAEKRIDVATQGGEFAKQQLGKHQNQLDKELGDIEAQREKMSQIDKQHSERELASEKQLQALTAQLENIKAKPGASEEATAELEQQIEELKRNGVDKEKYDQVARAVAKMQNMQQVDDKTLKGLVSQVRDAQAKAEELVKTRADVGSEIDQTTAGMQDEIDQLKQQLARFREVEQTVSALQPMVQDVIAPKVERLAQRQQVADTLSARKTAQAFVKKDLGGAVDSMVTPNTRQMELPGMPAKTPQQMNLPSVNEDKLFKLIKWATEKK